MTTDHRPIKAAASPAANLGTSGQSGVALSLSGPAVTDITGNALLQDSVLSSQRSRVWRQAWPWLIAFAMACGWDRAVWLWTSIAGAPAWPWIEESADQLGPALQQVLHGNLAALSDAVLGLSYGTIYMYGRVWPWVLLAAGLIFSHWMGTDPARAKLGLRRGLFVVGSALLGGAFSEILKLLSRRGRPEVLDGWYQFRSFLDQPLSGSNLGLASSHASVAMAGALAAALVLPRFRWFFLLLAILCGLSRIIVGAHFLSDVVAGCGLGLLAYRLVYALDARLNPGVSLKPVAQVPADSAR